ncbi:MAG TPA: DUF5317 family protein [Chloroflexota bacterium]|nr:DUF5317 family protein [Chloroflexota bacterium]
MILAFAVLVGAVVALARGGSLKRLGDLPIRLAWLALLCLLVQVYIIYCPEDQLEARRTIQGILMVLSYGALAYVVWVNRRINGMTIILLGILLNLVVMAANGGFMPVSREAILATGTRTVQTLPAEGSRLSRSKDVLLSPEQARVWFLGDVIMAPSLPVPKVLSVGDLVVALGAFVLLQAAMVPGKRAHPIEEGAGTA